MISWWTIYDTRQAWEVFEGDSGRGWQFYQTILCWVKFWKPKKWICSYSLWAFWTNRELVALSDKFTSPPFKFRCASWLNWTTSSLISFGLTSAGLSGPGRNHMYKILSFNHHQPLVRFLTSGCIPLPLVTYVIIFMVHLKRRSEWLNPRWDLATKVMLMSRSRKNPNSRNGHLDSGCQPHFEPLDVYFWLQSLTKYTIAR